MSLFGYGAQYGVSDYSFEVLGTPPILQNQDPAPNETGVSRSVNIILELIDELTGIEAASVIIKIDGDTAWSNDAAQVGYSGTKTSITDGFRYEIDPDDLLPNLGTVTINVYAETVGGASLDESYLFYIADEVGPILSNLDPRANENYVELNRPIWLDLTDTNGVNGDSIEIYVKGVEAWKDNEQKIGFTVTRTVIVDGFRFKIVPDELFQNEEIVSVRVISEDSYPTPTSSDRFYTFQAMSVEPTIALQLPEPDEFGDISANIEISAEHKYGINLSVSKVWVRPSNDDIFYLVFDGGTFLSGYNGAESEVQPLSRGYKITIDKEDNYQMGATITVQAHIASNF